MAKVVTSNAIVLELLNEDNYFKWSTLMKTYFVAKDLWDVVEGNNVEIQNPTGTKIEERTKSQKVEDRCDDHESTSKTKDGDDHEEPPKVLKDGVDHVPGDESSKSEDGRTSQTADQTPKSKDGDDHHHKSQKLIKDCIIDNHDGFPKPEDGATKLTAETPESEDGDDDHHDQSPNLNKDGDGDHDGSPKPEGGNHGAISQKLEDSTKAEDIWKAWVIKNATALHAIRISCGSEAFSVIMNASTAKSAWDTLETKFKPQFLRQLPVQTNKINDDIPAAYESFYKTIVRGDWKRAKAFVVGHPEALTARINSLQETALHVAAVYGHLRIVEELLKLMSVKDSELQQDQGYTALSLAAMAGIVPMAKCLIKKNKGLAKIKSFDGLLPVVKAIYVGHFDMARYLYYITDLDLTGQDNMNGAILLNQFILSKHFNMALDLIKRCPRLAVATGTYIVPSPVVIAMCKSAFPSGSPLAFWQNWIYKCIQIPTSATNDTCIHISGDSTTTGEDTHVHTCGELDKEPDERIKKATTIVSGVLRGIGSYLFEFLGIKKIYELKLIHVQSQELLRCILGNLKTFMSEDRRLVTDVAHQAMFQAVEEGNVEFVIEISRTIPELIRHVDHRQRSVFSYAVECRQAEIFSLVHGFVILKEEIAAITDDYGNTVLHMAAKLAPSSHLSRISGAALQMQRELQWFKEVESIMQNKLINKEYYLNGKGMTPREFFTENHKELAKEGEKWMKETAANCTFVAALIVTIMFAAAFMIPGGNDQEKKLTTISHEKWFLLFIISDAISLFSSTTSVLMFLGILTSRYYEDAFLRSLPTKLIIGLSTLFFSIATMMISFCSALYVMMQGQQCILIPVILLASVPVTLFVSLQFPLLVEIFVSTYGSGIFTRKYANWLLQ